MNAIILAAGNSSRMKKDGYVIPKPLLPILGVPNIERTVLMLQEFGIKCIIILCRSEDVEKYEFLQNEYGCKLVSSPLTYNTLHTMSLVVNEIDDTFVIEGDVVLAKNILRTSEHSFYYTMRYEICESDAWCPTVEGNRITEFRIGCFTEPCIFGVSFWAHKDREIVRAILSSYFTEENFKNSSLFWDNCFANALDSLHIGTYEISPLDACEMNTGSDYLFAQDICEKYYRNCEKFVLDYNGQKKPSNQSIELVYVEDLDTCLQWHKRLINHTSSISQVQITSVLMPTVFTEGEHPYMVMDARTGIYVAYFDVAETNEYVLLRRLFVDEEYRRKGIGSKIVKHIKLFAKLANREMRVNVYDNEAEMFYAALGMKLYFKTFRFCLENL